MEVSTELIRVMRPVFVNSFPFQPANLAAILSMSSCRSILHSLPKERGNPRYLQGKELISPSKSDRISSTN